MVASSAGDHIGKKYIASVAQVECGAAESRQQTAESATRATRERHDEREKAEAKRGRPKCSNVNIYVVYILIEASIWLRAGVLKLNKSSSS